MSKIDRRDYLKQMAAAGVFTGITKSKLVSSKRSLWGKKPYQDWPRIETPPYQPTVLVHFWGLMAFSYEGRGSATDARCEIGIHKTAQTEPMQHQLKVYAFENCQRVNIGDFENFPDGTKFTLRIDGRNPDVKFFMPGDFKRHNKQESNPQDFRWLIDFEANDFYKKKLSPLRAGIYTKRIRIQNGTLLTHATTASSFSVEGGPSPKSNIYLPRVMSAQFVLESNEEFVLEKNETRLLTLERKQGVIHEIHFANLCYQGGKPCEKDDFHLNFDATNIPAQQRFKLKLKTKSQVSVPLCSMLAGVTDDIPKVKVSDESPCMGAGYGQGPLPDFPPG